MVVIKKKDGSKKRIKAKSIYEEILEAGKEDIDVDEVYISKIVTTPKEVDRGRLKDLCTRLRIDVVPLDRNFLKHKIFIREDTIKKAYGKLIKFKTGFEKIKIR